MDRRTLIACLGAAAASLPVAVRAQQGRMPVVGILFSTEGAGRVEQLNGIRNGLREAGFVEGQTIVIQIRSADGVYDRLLGLVAEMVAARVDVIIAQAPPAARAAKAGTTTVPVVFGVGIDPVEEGLVESLGRPGGNMTGATLLSSELMLKRFSLLAELVPTARHHALLMNPHVPNPWLGGVEAAARAKGIRLLTLEAATTEEIDAAFARMAQERAEALLIGEDTFLAQRQQIADLAIHHRIPSMGLLRRFTNMGGLASYGTNLTEVYRLVGTMVGRILKGEKPADLAIQRSTKFDLTLNLKTAKMLGLTVPPLILAQADEVIE